MLRSNYFKCYQITGCDVSIHPNAGLKLHQKASGHQILIACRLEACSCSRRHSYSVWIHNLKVVSNSDPDSCQKKHKNVQRNFSNNTRSTTHFSNHRPSVFSICCQHMVQLAVHPCCTQVCLQNFFFWCTHFPSTCNIYCTVSTLVGSAVPTMTVEKCENIQ